MLCSSSCSFHTSATSFSTMQHPVVIVGAGAAGTFAGDPFMILHLWICLPHKQIDTLTVAVCCRPVCRPRPSEGAQHSRGARGGCRLRRRPCEAGPLRSSYLRTLLNYYILKIKCYFMHKQMTENNNNNNNRNIEKIVISIHKSIIFAHNRTGSSAATAGPSKSVRAHAALAVQAHSGV